MAQVQMVDLIKRIGVSVLYVVGMGLAAYHIIAFRVAKNGGLYFKDENQLWFAIGVGLITVGWVIRNWKKL